MPDEQATKVAEPGDGPFDFPSTGIPSQRSAVLFRWGTVALAMGTNHFNSMFSQLLSQRLGVIGASDRFSWDGADACACAPTSHH